MDKIELFGLDSTVHTVEIFRLRGESYPKVVTWEDKTFLHASGSRYQETATTTSLTPWPGLPVEAPPGESADVAQPAVEEHGVSITTLHGTPVDELREKQRKQKTGMHDDYIVLTEEERAKGFVRTVRHSYKHVGAPGPRYTLADLTSEQHERYDQYGYVKYEAYPDGSSGMFWTQTRLDSIDKGCGAVTRMGASLAETYARDPHFYGSTFCVSCNCHLPVGEQGEFVWEGTDERVGT